jgi:hypothetical protein
MEKIKEITICLHCGCSMDVVNHQINLLKPLEQIFKVHWNLRIERHPDTYDSFSEMINDDIISSPTEIVVFINDRCHPKPYEVLQMLEMLENGFAVSAKYSVAFMAMSKEVIRKIGWWDERYYGGGYDDDDFVLRLRMANLSYYESLEGQYDMSWKTPLQPIDGRRLEKSEPFFQSKWQVTNDEIKRVITEESYEKYEGKLGPSRPDISDTWTGWDKSKVNIFFRERGSLSRTHWFVDNNGNEYRKVTSI